MDWVLLALLAPITWACANYVDKFAIEKYTKSLTDFLFFSSFLGWLFVPGIIFFFGLPVFNIYSIYAIILGMLLLSTYGFYGKALKLGETSSVMLLTGLIPVFTIFVAWLFLNQTITATQGLASIIVVLGASVISIKKMELKSFLMPGTGWILIPIVMWACIFTAADYVLENLTIKDFVIYDMLGTSLAGLLLLLWPGSRKQVLAGLKTATPQKFMWFGLNNLFDATGQVILKTALYLAPSAGLVIIVMQIQHLYVIALGAVLTIILPNLFDEDLSWRGMLRKLAGAALMVIGVTIITIEAGL